ncbi:MAG TPA: hypothetical protein VIH18_02870 [Candidatus Binatia bacterium]
MHLILKLQRTIGNRAVRRFFKLQRSSEEKGGAPATESEKNAAVPRVEIQRPTDTKIAEGIFSQIMGSDVIAAFGSALIFAPANSTQIAQFEQMNATLEWENPRKGLFSRREKGVETEPYTIDWAAPDRDHPQLEIRDNAVFAQDTHTYSMVVMPGMKVLKAAEEKGLLREQAEWKYTLEFAATTSYVTPTGKSQFEPWGFKLVVQQVAGDDGLCSRTAQLEYWGVHSIKPILEMPKIEF